MRRRLNNGFHRRDFLKTGLAAGLSLSRPAAAAFLPSPSSTADHPLTADVLRGHIIWSSQSVPVPLRQSGPAAAIASSSPDHASTGTPDLHVVFYKEFTLPGVSAGALIHLFACTRYRLYINGVYQGRGPCRYQNQRPEYDTRNVTAALRPGKNTITVLVHRDAPTGRIMRHAPGFCAVLRLQHGSRIQAIPTDASWLSVPDLSFGPRPEAWASIEEHIDAQHAIELENPGLSVAGWPASLSIASDTFFPLWPRTEALQKEFRRDWSAGTPVLPVPLTLQNDVSFDLPEIVQGYHLLQLEADAGSELQVTYHLPQGADSGAGAYIARAGVQTWMGGDTFAHNKLSIRLQSGSATLLQASVVEVRYPFERVASFHSSDPFLNQLWNICARSLELLSEDSYVDCAGCERVEWTDDSPPAFDLTRVLMRGPDTDGQTYWGDNRLLKGLLRRISLTQQPDGQLKAHSCSERFDIHAIMEDRSCDWVILLRQYYESCGDKQLVRELWPTLTRLMPWYLTRRTGRGLVLAREWEVWDNPLRYQVCEGAGVNAFAYRAFYDAAYLADTIGRTAESKAYAAQADALHASFNTQLWNPDQETYDGALFGPGSKTATQLNDTMFPGPIVNGRYHPTAQAALFALYCGIVPKTRIPAVQTWLLAHLDEILSPMSHYHLFHALYEMENRQHDSGVLQRMRTAWKNQVDSPWQTTWETLEPGGGSKAHIYGMTPGSFLTTHVLGARRVGHVADRSILIEPRCGDLTSAAGIAVTEFGPVQLSWSKNSDGTLSLKCALPPGTTTTLRLYKAEGAGSLVIDRKRHQGRVQGDFIEATLLAGSHTVEYPA